MRKKLLTNGNVFKRTDGRWGGVIWYMDEQGERKRKSFSGTTKQEANKKITAYIAEFENMLEESDESKKLLKDSIQNWLEIFKFPAVEQTTYDRCECTAKSQIYPILGDKVVGDIVAADIKNLLNHWMNKGLSFSTVKKAYVLLNEYFSNSSTFSLTVICPSRTICLAFAELVANTAPPITPSSIPHKNLSSIIPPFIRKIIMCVI